MKTFAVLLLFLIPYTCFSQEETPYRIDGNNIVVSKVIDDIDANSDEIYIRAKSYFARAYVNSNAVLQTDNRETGTIIGKGLYMDLASYNLGVWRFKAYHFLRVDIKDGKARIICSASTIMPYTKSTDEYEYSIIDHYPITDKRNKWATKGSQKKAFENLINNMQHSVDALGESLKKGGTLNIEQEEW